MVNLRILFLAVFILFIPAGVPASQENEIVFAISPMASPVSTLSSYSDFIKYLSEKTGIEVVLKQRRTYSEINSLLETGKAQFAFTCTGAYLNGRSGFGLELLTIPVINGKTSYNSYIIVNKESEIRKFSELGGKVFAFTDPLSLSGTLYPLHLLNTMGVKPGEFFRKTFYTASHEKSIESVSKGLADGAAVDSLIFEDMKRLNVSTIEKVRIIHISPPYGIPPIVASPLTEKSTKQIFLKTFLKMAEYPQGKEILNKLGIERFIIPDPAIYHSTVRMRRALLSE